MKNIILATLATGLLTLNACSAKKEDKAIDIVGNCKAETITSFKALGKQMEQYSISKNDDELPAIVKSCAELKALLDGKSCKAENTATQEIVDVSYNDFAEACEAANTILSLKKAAIPPEIPTAPKEDASVRQPPATEPPVTQPAPAEPPVTDPAPVKPAEPEKKEQPKISCSGEARNAAVNKAKKLSGISQCRATQSSQYGEDTWAVTVQCQNGFLSRFKATFSTVNGYCELTSIYDY